MSLFLTLKRFTPFLSISFLNFGKFCGLRLPAEFKVQTSKNYETCKDRANYAILTKHVKLQHENKPVSNLLSMQSVGKKAVVETISVAITDSSDVRYLDLCLINIFTKSTKAERYTDITFKLTLYCLSVTIKDPNF